MAKKKNESNPKAAWADEAQQWNAIAEGWHSWSPRMREWYAPATALMLDLAHIDVGSRVLDIAAGDCDQSMAAARRVGSKGYVLAVDVADRLLATGAQFAREAGFQNIETRVMDGGNLDLPDDSFDAVICRFALMYLPDPILGLRGMKRVLKSAGRVSVVVYGVNGSPEFSVAVAEVRRHLGLPQSESSAHSLGQVSVLQQSLEAGGFSQIEMHSLDLPVHMASIEECIHYLQATSPTLSGLTAVLSHEERKDVWDEVQQALSIFEGARGFEIIHKVIVAAGSAG